MIRTGVEHQVRTEVANRDPRSETDWSKTNWTRTKQNGNSRIISDRTVCGSLVANT